MAYCSHMSSIVVAPCHSCFFNYSFVYLCVYLHGYTHAIVHLHLTKLKPTISRKGCQHFHYHRKQVPLNIICKILNITCSMINFLESPTLTCIFKIKVYFNKTITCMILKHIYFLFYFYLFLFFYNSH
jgi:hypothetical protein